jgi:four helix bundle protein
VRFYNTSEASLEELKYYFLLCQDLGYVTNGETLMSEGEVVSKMLYRLCERVRSADSKR